MFFTSSAIYFWGEKYHQNLCEFTEVGWIPQVNNICNLGGRQPLLRISSLFPSKSQIQAHPLPVQAITGHQSVHRYLGPNGWPMFNNSEFSSDFWNIPKEPRTQFRLRSAAASGKKHSPHDSFAPRHKEPMLSVVSSPFSEGSWIQHCFPPAIILLERHARTV